jgi:hypothetical protein
MLIPSVCAGHPMSGILHVNVNCGFWSQEKMSSPMPIRDAGGHILRLNYSFAPLFCSLFAIMAPSQLLCGYCNHKAFNSKRAWTQHLKSSARCAALMNSKFTSRDHGLTLSHKHMPSATVHGMYKGPKTVNKPQRKGRSAVKSVATSHLKESHYNQDLASLLLDDDDDDDSLDDNNEGFFQGGIVDGHDDESMQEEAIASEAMLKDWKEYVQRAKGFAPFDERQRHAIELLSLLRTTKASLNTYESMMTWHMKCTGEIHSHEKASDNANYVSRDTLLELLKKRYNRDKGYGQATNIVLPSTKVRAKMVINDAQKTIQSLLTRPEIRAKDYLFHGDNPLAPPPAGLSHIADLNTGKSYYDTWHDLIKDPSKQILLPIVMYMDGSQTGVWADLELTPVKIALGIFNRVARKQAQFWGTLGYIPSITKDKSRGRRALVDSGHADTTMQYHQLMRDEGMIGANMQNAHPAQDLHTMLDTVLEGFVKLQKTGFKWDLAYNGKLYKGVEFVPFVMFMRADMEEADKLCGAYTCRALTVSQLCQKCECPSSETNNHLANYPPKMQKKIERLCQKKDLVALKSLSQQPIVNAFYKLQFGTHNGQGIHGACPMDMLHAILLGIFKYIREVFFDDVGESSQTAQAFDAICMAIGDLLSRQSDRDMPNTRFPNGIRRGKMNGKRFTGVLVCLYAAICSEQGQHLLRKSHKKWRVPGKIEDWIMLLETLLQWEAWLKSDKMALLDVHRAKKKHRYVMYLIRKVAKRTKGNGLKIPKFHGVLHMADEILNFGVPLEFDTGDNESHHIPAKVAARLTQKVKDNFEESTSRRLIEKEVLDLAHMEMQGKVLWEYRNNTHFEDESESVGPDSENIEPEMRTIRLGGEAYQTHTNPLTGNLSLQPVKKLMPGKAKPRVELDLVEFVMGLEEKVSEHLSSVPLHTTYTRDGIIFRGAFDYREHIWRDWVVVDWGRDGKLPNKLWGFVDLRRLPGATQVNYGGVSNLHPSIYAIVEATELSPVMEGNVNCEIFIRLHTEVGAKTDGYVSELKFYLADVEAFVDPCIVIPNLGGETNSYFWVQNRSKWAESFVNWLRAPHQTDEMDRLNENDESENENDDSDSDE